MFGEGYTQIRTEHYHDRSFSGVFQRVPLAQGGWSAIQTAFLIFWGSRAAESLPVLCNWRGISFGGIWAISPNSSSDIHMILGHQASPCPMVCPTRHVDRTWTGSPSHWSHRPRGWWKSIHSNLSTIWGTYGAVEARDFRWFKRAGGVERWVLK